MELLEARRVLTVGSAGELAGGDEWQEAWQGAAGGASGAAWFEQWLTSGSALGTGTNGTGETAAGSAEQAGSALQAVAAGLPLGGITAGTAGVGATFSAAADGTLDYSAEYTTNGLAVAPDWGSFHAYAGYAYAGGGYAGDGSTGDGYAGDGFEITGGGPSLAGMQAAYEEYAVYFGSPAGYFGSLTTPAAEALPSGAASFSGNFAAASGDASADAEGGGEPSLPVWAAYVQELLGDAASGAAPSGSSEDSSGTASDGSSSTWFGTLLPGAALWSSLASPAGGAGYSSVVSEGGTATTSGSGADANSGAAANGGNNANGAAGHGGAETAGGGNDDRGGQRAAPVGFPPVSLPALAFAHGGDVNRFRPAADAQSSSVASGDCQTDPAGEVDCGGEGVHSLHTIVVQRIDDDHWSYSETLVSGFDLAEDRQSEAGGPYEVSRSGSVLVTFTASQEGRRRDAVGPRQPDHTQPARRGRGRSAASGFRSRVGDQRPTVRRARADPVGALGCDDAERLVDHH